MPGTGNDKTLRFFAFIDAGNVWGDDDPVTFGSLRASAGLGLSWISPMGPLKMSYGTPIASQPTIESNVSNSRSGPAF